jgi:hypothetical protein
MWLTFPPPARIRDGHSHTTTQPLPSAFPRWVNENVLQ